MQAQREQLIAAALDEREKRALNRLLRKLLLSFEDAQRAHDQPER